MNQEGNNKPLHDTTVTMSSGTMQAASPGVATVTNPTFPGAINLTITNGAINIQQATGGGVSVGSGQLQVSKGETLTAQPMGTLVKATNLQSLQGGQGMKIPIIAAQPHAVNLKIPSPLNLRMAQPATSLPQNTNPTHIMAQRHPVLFSSAQLRPGQTPVLQSIGSQIPVTQLTHHQGGTNLIPQNAILPPGARFISAQQLQQGQVIANMRPLRPQGQGHMTNKQGQVTAQNSIQLNAASSLPAGSTIVSNITSIPYQSNNLGVTSFSATGLPAHALLVTAPITSGMALTNTGAHLVPAAQINLNLPTTGAITQLPQGTPINSANVSKEGTTTPVFATSQVPAESTIQVAGRNTPEIRKAQQENKILKEDKGIKEEKDKTTPVSDNNEKQESDFDPASALDWENGIGTLPGSNLKFKLNEFGVMELVSDELECNETLDTSGNTEKDDEVKSTISENSDTLKVKEEAKSPRENKNSGEISQCESCGTYGMPSEFCFDGRFCSKLCAANFANRKQHKIKHTTGDKPLLVGLKKKKKRSFDDEDGFEEPLKVLKAEADDGTARKIPVLTIAKKVKGFSWSNYLESERALGAHPKLFKGQAFPATKTGFKVGMRLEGIDPKHPTLYCVLSVTEVRGYRVRQHFDGYSECHDFWTNADSPFIFPVGWAEKNGKALQPPKGYTTDTFTWSSYLKAIRQIAAHKNLFNNTQATSVTPHGFRAGLKLEAVDKTNMALTCVATVKDVLGDRTLIHFDGWEDCYDYWCDPSSPYVHPIGWCQETSKPLSPPNDWPDIEGFTWEDYLAHTKSTPVPARAFKVRIGHSFDVGMKLEVVDPKNPILIRVATIVQIETFRLLIHFDGWDAVYDFWSDDDNPDIHPPGWCGKTGHPLEPPISPSEIAHSPSQSGCPTPGCKGVGHVKGAKYTGHHSAFGCPYSQVNMIKEGNIPDRLGSGRRESHAPDTPTEPTSANKLAKSFDYPPASPEIQKKCPTPDCDGQGHVTGKYTNHHRLSGCPLYEKNIEKMKKIQNSLPTFTQAPINGETGRPLFGPGSGRGRKKKTLIKAWREQEANKEAAIQNGIHQSIFMSSLVPNVEKEESLCWDQHSKLLPGVNKHRLSDVESWGTEQVAKFVSELPGCRDHGKTFLEEQIDGEAFLLLNQNDIVKIMNVKLGPALKIYNSILMVKNNVDI